LKGSDHGQCVSETEMEEG